MAIEQKYTDLINAAIDGEISAGEKAELEAFLEESAEGRALHDELASLCNTLEELDQEAPPVHLRHVIMNSAPKTPKPDSSPGFLHTLLGMPAFKYAFTFAAGVILALTVVDSSQVSNRAFDDVTGLVGTIAQPVDSTLASAVSVDELDVAGVVSLRSAGSLMILDFDLVSKDPIEIEAGYRDPSLWFNGFAQLESEGTTVSAETGRVRLGMQGKRAAPLTVSCTSGIRKFQITVVRTSWRPIVSNRNNSRIFCQDGTHMLFDAMRTLCQVDGQLHKNIIKIRSAHVAKFLQN